jgi:hypothetical protein
MVGFPLLLIPLAIYNIVVFLMPGVSLSDAVVTVPLMSGDQWPVTLSDILLALASLMLMFEVIKGARPGAKYLTDHLLSLIVTGAAIAEFVLWKRFGTSTFFLLTLLSAVDFLTSIALRARRRTIVVTEAPVVSRKSARAVAPVAEPQFDPAPAPAPMPAPPPAMPAATSVAESVLLDHPAPNLAQPAVTPAAVPHVEPAPVASSPEVPSPDLQPGNGITPPEAPKP